MAAGPNNFISVLNQIVVFPGLAFFFFMGGLAHGYHLDSQPKRLTQEGLRATYPGMTFRLAPASEVFLERDPFEWVHRDKRFVLVVYYIPNEVSDETDMAVIGLYALSDGIWSVVAQTQTGMYLSFTDLPRMMEFDGRHYLFTQKHQGMGNYSRFHIYDMDASPPQEIPWNDYMDIKDSDSLGFSLGENEEWPHRGGKYDLRKDSITGRYGIVSSEESCNACPRVAYAVVTYGLRNGGFVPVSVVREGATEEE